MHHAFITMEQCRRDHVYRCVNALFKELVKCMIAPAKVYHNDDLLLGLTPQSE